MFVPEKKDRGKNAAVLYIRLSDPFQKTSAEVIITYSSAFFITIAVINDHLAFFRDQLQCRVYHSPCKNTSPDRLHAVFDPLQQVMVHRFFIELVQDLMPVVRIQF